MVQYLLKAGFLKKPILTSHSGNQNLNEFGVDPNIDPELAMVRTRKINK